jgi:hypothetical protein
MVGSPGRRARLAGARSCIWTTVWCILQPWSSTCSPPGARPTFADVQGGDAIPSTSSRGGAELSLETGTTTTPSSPVPTDDLVLSPTFVQTLAAVLAVGAVFGHIVRGAAAALTMARSGGTSGETR